MDKRDLQSARRRTIQDDRRELGTDAEDDSELTTRPDAPLAEDAVREKDVAHERVPKATPPAFMGGAPVPPPPSSSEVEGSAGMTAAEDRPIND